ncbi:sensor domain-containing diguanylate cyclase [Paludibacterium paludis]|uniref:diguanylate cyclase n=1 Tax=Paludibacterium paludis TaxID=1225769 RepID=A0A918P2D8_9NEIS|nr:sensor domain-containing diguanylate cyclase [Paludibacterium paludis]GGY14121.1 hypothetical protein GCM10011289_16850 [Paludibacterium paludis]
MRRKTQGIVLCILLFVAAFTAAGIDLYRSRNEIRERGFASAEAMSFLVSEWLAGSFREVDYVVRNVTDVIHPGDLPPFAPDAERRADITRLLIDKHKSLPHSDEIGVFDGQCRLAFAAYSPIGWDASDRDYCKALRANPALDHFTTNLLWSNLNKYEVVHLRPLTDSRGRLVGIAGAGLDLSFFQRWLDRVHIGPHDTVAIVDNRGRILARHGPATPGAPKGPGHQLDYPLQRQVAALSLTGAARRFPAELDDRPALVSLQHLGAQPIAVLVGLDEATLMREWNDKAAQFAFGLALIGILIVLLLRNVWLAEERAELLFQQACTDPLTRLANRRHFFETALRELARADRNLTPCGFILLDIDNFKEINDLYGHRIGDLALVAVANACLAIIRDTDTPARLGGDEFVILIPDADPAGAMAMANRLLDAIRAIRIQEDNSPTLQITASFGIALSQHGELTPEAPLSRADSAMYEAKRAGRDTLCMAADRGLPPTGQASA